MATDTSIRGSVNPAIYSNPMRYPNAEGVDSVEKAGALGFGLDEWQNEALAAVEFPVAGICAPRQQGKTYLGLARAITAAAVDQESVVFLTHSQMQSRHTFQCAQRMIDSFAHSVAKQRLERGRERIEFLGAGTITFSAGSRRVHCDRLIVDDAMTRPESIAEIQEASGFPAHMLLLGSAPHQGKAVGPFPELRHRALSDRNPDAAWLEWSVPDAYDNKGKLQIDPYDPAVIAVANPAYRNRMRDDDYFIRREALVMSESMYLVERLGISDWS